MILSAKHLKKTYIDSDQKIEVLTDACLDVKAGDLICITGKSGSGKSTMLHIMGLLDAPDFGELIIGGRKIEAQSPDAPKIRNQDLGFVFQFHYLVEDLTATENVALPLLIAGENEAEAMERAQELLCILGLSERLRRYPNQLSGGEQQRVSLARALANRPKLVLADEPTGNLDPTHSKEVWDLILKLNKGEFKQTFVIVTHDVEAAQAADQVFELVNGILIPA